MILLGYLCKFCDRFSKITLNAFVIFTFPGLLYYFKIKLFIYISIIMLFFNLNYNQLLMYGVHIGHSLSNTLLYSA